MAGPRLDAGGSVRAAGGQGARRGGEAIRRCCQGKRIHFRFGSIMRVSPSSYITSYTI